MLKRNAKPIRLTAVLFLVAVATTSLYSASAAAQQGRLCGERDKVISQLQSIHGESRQSVGLQRDARVMETYANPDTGSWTIIVSMPSGMACLVAAGEAFQGEAGGRISQDDPA